MLHATNRLTDEDSISETGRKASLNHKKTIKYEKISNHFNSVISVFVMGCAYRILFLIMPVVTNLKEALVVALFVGFITFCALTLCYLVKSLIIETFKK